MDDMKRIESEVRGSVDDAQASLDEGIRAADVNSIDPSPPATDGSTADSASESVAEAQASLDESIRAADVSSIVPPPDADATTAYPANESASESIDRPTPESSVKADLPGH